MLKYCNHFQYNYKDSYCLSGIQSIDIFLIQEIEKKYILINL